MTSVSAVATVSPQSNSNKADAQPEVTGVLGAHPLRNQPAGFCERFLCGMFVNSVLFELISPTVLVVANDVRRPSTRTPDAALHGFVSGPMR